MHHPSLLELPLIFGIQIVKLKTIIVIYIFFFFIKYISVALLKVWFLTVGMVQVINVSKYSVVA